MRPPTKDAIIDETPPTTPSEPQQRTPLDIIAAGDLCTTDTASACSGVRASICSFESSLSANTADAVSLETPAASRAAWFCGVASAVAFVAALAVPTIIITVIAKLAMIPKIDGTSNM